ncbi:MAG: hypothetical protein ABJO09_04585 [Hyphomicrobiales bacterium]|uniref:hypothetical protein n=1 Tax=Nisaea sp. TaxID=2024842 RepID=UPI00328EAC05
MTRTVLVLGSAPDAVRARNFDMSAFSATVAINHAWQIQDDWTHLVHAGDFPSDSKPTAKGDQKIVSYESYVPANNAFGGIVYAGGTMAFTTAYWALKTLTPDIIAFCGCDMVYNQPDGQSHFYGKGEADPLRKDPTLQSLEAKANRLLLLALQEECLCVNLSELPDSRLTFPRLAIKQFSDDMSVTKVAMTQSVERGINTIARTEALRLEQKTNCTVPSGDYWRHMEHIHYGELAKIDEAWLKSFNPSKKTVWNTGQSPAELADFV